MDTLGGLWELMRLAIKSRLRFRAGYWKWRYETAFGTDPSRRPPFRERVRAMIEYGKWVHRMRRRL